MIRLFLTDVDGVLTDSTYLVLPTGERAKSFNTRDWCGMEELRRAGCHTGIISGDASTAIEHQVRRVAERTALFQGIDDKRKFVAQAYLKPHGDFEWDDIAFIGDDKNDLKLLQAVGYPACPLDAVEEVRETIARFPDGLILNRKGGEGCVREFTDLIRLTWYNGGEV